MPQRTPNFVHFDHPEGGRTVKVGACHRDPQRAEHTHYDASQWASDDLPPFVDLRPHLTPVEDQGDLGSCTANALAGAVEYLEKRLHGREERVSRLFLYWNERDLEGKSDQDHGACIDDGIRALHRDGICAEKVWPYDVKRVFRKPADDAYDEAEVHTIDEAHRVAIDLHHLKHCLAEGYPFVFGLQVYKIFQKTGRDGRVQQPDPSTHEHAGGHAMLCVGYSDKDEVFVVRNSWGPKWGDGGYCYIPFEYLANPDFAHDAWTVRKAHDLDFNQGAGGAELPHGEKDSFFSGDDDSGEQEDEDDDSGEEGDEDDDDSGEEGDEDEDDDDSGEEGDEDDDDPGEEGEDDDAGEEEDSEAESTEELSGELAELKKQEQRLREKLEQAKKRKK